MASMSQDEKQFATKLAAGAGVALLYFWFVIGGIRSEADALRETRSTQEQELNTLLLNGLPSVETVARAARDAERERAVLAQLEEHMAFQLPESFQPPEGRPMREHFDNRSARRYDELNERAVQARVSLPEGFGFVADEGSVEVDAQDRLVRLAVLDRITQLILDSVGPDGGKIEAYDPTAEEEWKRPRVGEEERPYLKVSTVRVRFTVDARCAFAVVHGLQTKGHYLAVEELKVTKTDPRRDVVSVDLVAAALRLDRDGTVGRKYEE